MAIDTSLILLIGLTFFFLVSGAITSFVILSRMRWPIKCTIIQNISGKGYTELKPDRCRVVAFGDGGEEIILLKRRKKYRVGYGKRVGTNKMLWAIGEDGYWYNTTYGDLDKKLLEIGVMPVDKSMRFATSSIRKGIENRYEQKSWMDKYGAILYFGLFFLTMLIFGVVIWIAFDKLNTISSTNAEAIKSSKLVVDAATQLLQSMANLQQGGSGLVPAT